MITLHKSTVGPKGQITIPKEVRDRYRLKEGEEVIILSSDDGILVKHLKATLRGSLKGKLNLRGIENDVKELRLQWRRKETYVLDTTPLTRYFEDELPIHSEAAFNAYSIAFFC